MNTVEQRQIKKRGVEKMIKMQNFGFELEFNGITRQAVAAIIATKMGWQTPHYVGGTYDVWQIKDLKGKTWKIVYDGSIAGLSSQKCELVTPILQYEEIETLQEVVRIIKKAGGVADPSCGIHVHIDKARFTAKSIKNLVNIVYSKEDLIYEALKISSRREEDWCAKVDYTFAKSINSLRTLNLEKIADAWYKGNENRYSHYNRSRYHGLNLHNVWFANTIEFRYFNSSLHAGKVKSYVQFCLAMSAQAIVQKSAKFAKTETTNTKYTFRTWLLRLGLIGKEYATCRKFLLQNLEGCIAWKNGIPA
jgi:hypothetical protein